MLREHSVSQSRRVRIALLHYSYPPSIGGVERVVADHARLFAEAGHEVTVLCERGVSNDARIRLKLLQPSRGRAREAQLNDALRAVDIVFLHNVCTMPFDLELTDAIWKVAARLPSVRFVCWVHDLASSGQEELPRAAQLASDRFEYVAVSEYRRTQFQEMTGSHCRVIPNGVDPFRLLDLSEPVARLASERQLLSKEIVLLHPARVLQRKNIELGLGVTAALRDAGTPSCTLITAVPDLYNKESAQYASMLRRMCDELHIQNEAVFLHDHFEVNEHDLASLFRVADALFFPSFQEGFGLPILEGAIHRLPVFCADVEPINSWIPKYVRLFPPRAAPALIAAQIRSELQSSRETQARKIAARDYGWDAIYQNFLAPLLAETSSSNRP